MIIDGRAIADEILEDLKTRRKSTDKAITLGVLVGLSGTGDMDPVIESFVKIKSRVASDLGVSIARLDLPHGETTEAAMDAVRVFSQGVDALIVQLPLPAHIDTNAVLTEIPKAKDVDGINPILSDHERLVYAPVALATQEILTRAGVDPQGKRAVIVGAGRLVGSPTAWLLKHLGATVSMFTLDDGSIEDLKEADIVVLGAGNPGFIKPEHLKQDVVVIDAGTSEIAGVVCGDADPACADVASVFTPVPGGVGPIAVAMIFKNVFDLVEQHSQQ